MTATEAAMPVLQLRQVSKRFGAVQALSNVDFEVYSNEVVALVGDNGAGKSTLIKTIAGAYKPDEGDYVFEGKVVSVNSPRDATDLGVETVYQDLALCDNLDVVSNLYLGRENVRRSGLKYLDLLNETEMERRATEVLRDLSVKIPSVRVQIANLSGGQRQSVAVARSVMWNSKVVLLDEPTAALGVEQTRQVKDLIMRLRDRGLAVVVISHNVADVFEVSDRIIVMRLGRRVATFHTARSTNEQVIGAITGAMLPSNAYGEAE
ncbi:ATP-binding cassette domain-containing protein [Herpetosiphon geysericola]|uniref:Sugar ABC transporter ATP-binding protein n=1 Tax=Herpetosiphon geysericola TaxID=70996 RepID=A0A0N8GPZ5_9CHLR|nr:ATP-binding cassette domain-containing protein [Herpetosiphon geysericola]KPL82274.1 sugar ABC transporter ATP-binding protein [Herpetosiphon geysericola]